MIRMVIKMDNIKKIVDRVKEEISQVKENDGLCYFASNNVLFDLDMASIKAEMFNIREVADISFDHYFVLADSLDGKYLIDLTYGQFVKKDGKLRFFDRWPSEILLESKEGVEILEKLINDGYLSVSDNEFELYLKSFNPNFEMFFSLEDLMPSRTR